MSKTVEVNELNKHAVKSMLIELLNSDKMVLRELRDQIDHLIEEKEFVSSDEVECMLDEKVGDLDLLEREEVDDMIENAIDDLRVVRR